MAEYTRGQAEFALISHFLNGQNGTGLTKKKLKTRAKRLLELDSAMSESENLPCAFVTENKGAQGGARVFLYENVFNIGLGLELLDAGFKQSEVVFLLQHSQEILYTAAQRIKKYPNAFRQAVSSADYPDLPKDMKDSNLADLRTFFIFQRLDRPNLVKGKKAPLFLLPKICFGIESLASEINDISYSQSKATIVELGNLGISLNNHLKQAPQIKRGRPKTGGDDDIK